MAGEAEDLEDDNRASAAGPATSSRTECLAPTPPPSASTSLTHASRAETAGQWGAAAVPWRRAEEEEEGEGQAGDEGERGGEAANEAEKALRKSGGGGDDEVREEGEREGEESPAAAAAAAGVEGHGDCGEPQKSPPLPEAAEEEEEGAQEEESCTTLSAVADASVPDSPREEEGAAAATTGWTLSHAPLSALSLRATSPPRPMTVPMARAGTRRRNVTSADAATEFGICCC